MSIVQSFLIAIGMLRRNKLRSFLTMLGVIIGVMSVTVIVLISSAFQYFLTAQFNRLGTDTIFVMFDPSRGERTESVPGIEGLTMEDARYLKERVQSLDVVSALVQVPVGEVKREDHVYKQPRVFATDVPAIELNRIKVVQGRYFSQAEVESRSNVCVIGDELGEKLFPEGSPIGGSISMPGITLEIIGIFERMDMMGETNKKDVWLPITTAQDKWLGGDTISFISTRPKPGYNVDDTMNLVWQAMMLKSGNKRIYRVESREAILSIFGTVLGAAGAILAAIAALSLLVGGIGIMNIMLVSVTERTKEIGLRKAVGAKNNLILVQFLVESLTLSLVGGLIGMGVAWGLGQLITIVTASMNWPVQGGLVAPFPITAAIIATLLSGLIGIVFGLYPAVRAANLSPIEALRTE